MADPTTIWEVLNSEFVKSLTGAAMGAFAGAWGAQRIAERSKVREELLKEIRSVNAAVIIAYGVTESYIGVKKQLVKPLLDRFEAALVTFKKAEANRKPGQAVNFEIELRSFSLPKVPIDLLRQIAFERVSAPTRALRLIDVIDQGLQQLDILMAQRDEAMDRFKGAQPHPATYFGLETPAGADERYSSSLRGIAELTDNCIYFSKLLGDDLSAHGKALKAKLPERYRTSAALVVTANFEKAGDVFPPAENYRDWDTSYNATTLRPPAKWWKYSEWY